MLCSARDKADIASAAQASDQQCVVQWVDSDYSLDAVTRVEGMGGIALPARGQLHKANQIVNMSSRKNCLVVGTRCSRFARSKLQIPIAPGKLAQRERNPPGRNPP